MNQKHTGLGECGKPLETACGRAWYASSDWLPSDSLTWKWMEVENHLFVKENCFQGPNTSKEMQGESMQRGAAF